MEFPDRIMIPFRVRGLNPEPRTPQQVNTHYVKPVTLAAGGMSYALMKHPEGLGLRASDGLGVFAGSECLGLWGYIPYHFMGPNLI